MIVVLALSKVVINQCNKYHPPYCFGFIKKKNFTDDVFHAFFLNCYHIHIYILYICVHAHVNMELEIMRSAYE